MIHCAAQFPHKCDGLVVGFYRDAPENLSRPWCEPALAQAVAFRWMVVLDDTSWRARTLKNLLPSRVVQRRVA